MKIILLMIFFHFLSHQTKTASWLPPKDVWNEIYHLDASNIDKNTIPLSDTDIEDKQLSNINQHCDNDCLLQENISNLVLESDDLNFGLEELNNNNNNSSLPHLPYGWEIGIDTNGKHYYIKYYCFVSLLICLTNYLISIVITILVQLIICPPTRT